MSNQRRPWPMKWVIVAIIAILVPYTFLTLRYRKPGPAFQPYEDMKNQANVTRLLEAGYQRFPIPAQRPADDVPESGGAAVAEMPGGLPADLGATLVEVPLLPEEILAVTAAPTASTLRPYVIHLRCRLPDERRQLRGADLFVRGQELVIIPTFEPVPGELQVRTRQTEVRMMIPAGALKPGNYDVLLVGERSSRAWPLEVK